MKLFWQLTKIRLFAHVSWFVIEVWKLLNNFKIATLILDEKNVAGANTHLVVDEWSILTSQGSWSHSIPSYIYVCMHVSINVMIDDIFDLK